MHGWRRGVKRADASLQAFWVFDEAGVRKVLSDGGVGSLNHLLDPRDVVVPNDFIDLTTRQDIYVRGDHLLIMRRPVCPTWPSTLYRGARAPTSRASSRAAPTSSPTARASSRSPRSTTCGGSAATSSASRFAPEVVLARDIGACFAGIYMVVNYGEGVVREWEHAELKAIFHEESETIARCVLDTIADRRPRGTRAVAASSASRACWTSPTSASSSACASSRRLGDAGRRTADTRGRRPGPTATGSRTSAPAPTLDSPAAAASRASTSPGAHHSGPRQRPHAPLARRRWRASCLPLRSRMAPSAGLGHAAMDEDDIAASAALGVLRCLQAGITVVGDIAYGPEAPASGAGAGGRLLLGGPRRARRRAPARCLGEEFPLGPLEGARAHPCGMSPHSAYTSGPSLLGAVATFASERGYPSPSTPPSRAPNRGDADRRGTPHGDRERPYPISRRRTPAPSPTSPASASSMTRSRCTAATSGGRHDLLAETRAAW